MCRSELSTSRPPRYYWRCRDCLSVFAVDGEYRDMRCACGGTARCMGRVQGVRLTRTEHLCPCDGRCTGASGPSCDCSCGGENHGTGRVVPVAVDVGAAPVASVVVGDKERARAEEYRAALAPLLAELNALRGRGWLAGPDYARLCNLEHRLAFARKSLTHSARMQCLRAAVGA